MNAILNIQVRVMSAQALSQLKALQTQLKQTQMSGAGAGAGINRGFGAGIAGALQKSTAFGKNLQWTGRQLEFNFTLPILLAGVAAAKWSNDVEKATTKVRKVYGDLSMSQDDVNDAVDHLSKSFEALSNIFGVHQSEVANIAALWAAAGAQGVALANATRKTMEVMILGEMDQEEAVKSLLTIQQAYGFSIDELGHKLDMLNTVENQTAISFAGLIDVVTRAGGAARTAGVDIEHLAAMAASLVPATGTAATAGNALRTIFSRLLAPTKQAADVMAKMGINTASAAWQSKNGVERLEELAKAFSDLTNPQQAVVSSMIASRFQINRFDVLMRAIVDPMSAYNRMLKETGNEQRNHATYLRELNTVLQSSPQAWKILTTQLQNALIKIIIPMMPAFLALASHVVKLADSFSKLNPNTQRWIMLGLIALAMFGPFVRYLGAFITLGSLILRVGEFAAVGLTKLAVAFGYTGAAATAANTQVAAASSGIFASIGSFIAGIPAMIGGALVSIIEFFIGLPAMFMQVITVIRTIATTMVTVWNAAFALIPQSVIAGAIAIQNTFLFLMDMLPVIFFRAVVTMQSAWIAFVETMSTLFMEGVVAIQALWVMLPDIFLSVVVGIQAAWISFVASIPSLLFKAVSLVAFIMDAIPSIFLAVVVNLQTAWIAFTGFMSEMFLTVVVNIQTLWLALMTAIPEMMLSATVFMQSAWIAFTAFLSDAFLAASVAISNGLATVTAFAASIPSIMASAFTWVREFIVTLPALIGQAVTWMIQFVQTIPSLVSGAITAVQGIITTGIGFVQTGFAVMGASAQIIPEETAVAVAEAEAVMATMPEAAAASSEATAVAFSTGWLAAIPLIIAGLAVGLVLIRQHWRSIIDWIVKVWNRAWDALPTSVQNAFRRVIAIIASAAKSVGEWLSHMNPFARHSPSLVDQVTKGTTVISDQYAGVSEAPDTVNRMSEAHRTLQSTTNQISSSGSTSAAASTGSASAAAYKMMQDALDKLTKAYASNQAAASRWSSVLANAKKLTDQFTAATAAGVQALEDAQMREQVKDILPFAPNAADFIDEIIASEHALKAALAELTIEIDKQQAVVDQWKMKLDAANNALDTAQAELDRLKDVAAAANDDLSNAQQTLDKLADTPIAGMRAMSDAIFANDMAVKQLQLTILNADRVGQGLNEQIYQNSIAQKRLQLEMLRMQDQVGMSADDARSKLAGLQGDIEKLNAQASDLRLAGAGSDVLGPINDQVRALEAQRQEIQASTQPLQDLQDQMNALQAQGQILDLEHDLNLAPLNHQLEILQQTSQALDLQNSLKFDPLTRELDQLINTMDEMPFDQIKQKIIEQKQVVNQLQGAYDQANGAVTAQQAIVDQLKASRDAINLTYDTETAKLGILKDGYTELNDQLQAIKTSWSDVASGASSANSAAEQFDAAGLSDFEDVGGAGGGFGDAGSLADIDALTAKWQKEIDASFGNFDMFKPLKDAWNSAWEWTKKNVGGAGGVMAVVGAIIGGFVGGPIGVAIGAGIGAGLGKPIMNGLKDAFGWASDNLDVGGAGNGIGSKIGDSLGKVFDSIGSFGGRLKQVGDMFGTVFDSIGRPLAVFGGMVATFFGDFTDMLGEQFKKWGPLLEPAIEAVGHVVNVIRMILRPLLDVFKIMLVGILAVWEFVWPMLLNVIKPIFDAIVAATKGWLEVIRGVISFVLAIINGDWGKAWDAIKTILAGVWDGIYGVVKGAFGLVYGIIKGFIQGIIGFFKFLYNTLIGHSIIPDLINGIIFFFNLLTTPIRLVFDGIKLILGAFKWFIETVLAPVFGWLWHSIIEPVFHGIAAFIGLEIEGLKVIFGVIKAFIEKVLAPVFTWLWHTIVEPAFNGIKLGISLAWDGIKGVFNAIKGFVENVLAPVFGWLWHNIIEPIWNGIQEATSRIWGGIQAVMRGAVNGVIKIINALINGINAIADHIPGINIHINTIKELGDSPSGPGDSSGAQKVHMVAKGGIFVPGFGMVPSMGVGSGFKTNRPTAIVGEGSKSYPEYIIPTDPQHRGRALALVDSLYRRFGGLSLPAHGIGFPNPLDIGRDIISGAGGVISDIGGWLRTNGAKAIVAPFFAAADKMIGALPESWIKDTIAGFKNNLYNWITGTDDEIASAVASANAAAAGQTTQKVHVMDRGGVLPPGLSAVFNGTGANEVLRPHSNDVRDIHFHGDLVFPNVEDGDDAEDFIRNLESLADA